MTAATVQTVLATYVLPSLTVILAIDRILLNVKSIAENSTFQVFNTVLGKVVSFLTTKVEEK